METGPSSGKGRFSNFSIERLLEREGSVKREKIELLGRAPLQGRRQHILRQHF
jgi:hypothetical protein